MSAGEHAHISRFVLALAVILLVVQANAAPYAGDDCAGDDLAAEAMSLLRAAYGHPRPHRVTWISPSEFVTPPPEDVQNTLPRLGQVRHVRSPDGRDLVAIDQYTGIGGPGGQFRVERRSLIAGGPAERATAVEIWTLTSLTTASSLVEKECRHDEYGELTYPQELELRAKGRVPHRRMAAEKGVGLLAGYALALLPASGDLIGTRVNGTTIEVTSREAGLSLSIDATSGKIIRAVFSGDAVGSEVYQYVGEFPPDVFPTKHPKEILAWYGPDAEQRSLAGRPADAWSVYDTVEIIPEPANETWEWRSVAPKAVDSFGRPADAPAQEATPAPIPNATPLTKISDDKKRLVLARAGRDHLQIGLVVAGAGLVVGAVLLRLRAGRS